VVPRQWCPRQCLVPPAVSPGRCPPAVSPAGFEPALMAPEGLLCRLLACGNAPWSGPPGHHRTWSRRSGQHLLRTVRARQRRQPHAPGCRVCALVEYRGGTCGAAHWGRLCAVARRRRSAAMRRAPPDCRRRQAREGGGDGEGPAARHPEPGGPRGGHGPAPRPRQDQYLNSMEEIFTEAGEEQRAMPAAWYRSVR